MPKIKKAAKAKKATTSKKVSLKKRASKKMAPTRLKSTKPAKKLKHKISAIPRGYASITPYLILDDATKAIEFYQKAFSAKVTLKLEQPNSNKILHAELKIGDAKIMLADESNELHTRSPKVLGGSPMHIELYVKNVDKIVERAVANGGTLLKPIENMYYGDRCGCIEDPHGYQWHISTHIEDVSTRELKKRLAQFFSSST